MDICYTERDHINTTAFPWTCVTRKETTLTQSLIYGHLLHEKRSHWQNCCSMDNCYMKRYHTKLLFCGHLLHEKKTTLTKLLINGHLLHEKRQLWENCYFMHICQHGNRPYWQNLLSLKFYFTWKETTPRRLLSDRLFYMKWNHIN